MLGVLAKNAVCRQAVLLLERDDSLLGCGAIDAICRTRKIAQLFQTVLDLADVLSLGPLTRTV